MYDEKHNRIVIGLPQTMETPIFIYCPNCGARMIDEVEE